MRVSSDSDKQHLQNDLDKLVKCSEKWQMLFNLGHVNAYIQDTGTWMETIKWEILFWVLL